jgi:hypothetical protein
VSGNRDWSRQIRNGYLTGIFHRIYKQESGLTGKGVWLPQNCQFQLFNFGGLNISFWVFRQPWFSKHPERIYGTSWTTLQRFHAVLEPLGCRLSNRFGWFSSPECNFHRLLPPHHPVGTVIIDTAFRSLSNIHCTCVQNFQKKLKTMTIPQSVVWN